MTKRVLAFLLSFLMLITAFPLNALADELTTATETPAIKGSTEEGQSNSESAIEPDAAPASEDAESALPSPENGEDGAEPSASPEATEEASAPMLRGAAPTPAPEPDYWFPEERVHLSDILTELGVTLSQNSYNISVDDGDCIELSHSKFNSNKLSSVTLTATDLFDCVTVTLVSSNHKDSHSFTVGWRGASPTATPEPTPTPVVELVERTSAEDGVWTEEQSMFLTGMLPENAVVETEPVDDVVIEGQDVLYSYDIQIFVDEQQGSTWQPDGQPVQVHLYCDGLGNGTVNIYHIPDDGEPEFVATVTAEDGWITFTAGSFSIYAITETTLSRTVTTSDGVTYEIEVTYTSASGIPMEGTALLVEPIDEDSEDFATYRAASMEETGASEKSLGLLRAFDIKIVNENDSSIVYEPTGNVDVSIRLVDESLSGYKTIDVLHFVPVEKENPEDGEDEEELVVTAMDSAVEGETITFTTDSFSVYVVSGQVPVLIYKFYTLDQFNDYVEYWFYTDGIDPETGEYLLTTEQIIKNGESPIAPQNPVDPQNPDLPFAGWYEGTPDVLNPNLEDTPYDFNHIPEITEEGIVYLYAKFNTYAYVIFHDQYDAETDTYPVLYTRRVELTGSAETDRIRLTGFDVAFENATMTFVGWSTSPIQTPGALLNVHGSAVTAVTTDEDGYYPVTGNLHLYPIFHAVGWLAFYSGPTGSGATYYSNAACLDGVGATSLDVPERDPSRDGPAYVFSGWYAGATLDANGEAILSAGAVKIADENGDLIAGAMYPAVNPKIKVQDGHIVLTSTTEDGKTVYASVTLYAVWTLSDQANYTIVVQRQKATDVQNTGDREYAESFILTGMIGDTVTYASLPEAYKTLYVYSSYNALHTETIPEAENAARNPYYGYTNVSHDDSVEITSDGSAILNIYYDWDDWSNPPNMSGKRFTLTFANTLSETATLPNGTELPISYDGSPGMSMIPYYTEVTEEGQTVYRPTEIVSYVPVDPVCTGYSFLGWYADEACTIRAFFTQESYDAYAFPNKVLYRYMPGANLTVYAGWSKNWYVVTLDPNYGAYYTYVDGELIGEGVTYFWAQYGELVQRNTTVTRNFVESASGTWYYVNHVGDGYGGNLYADRYTYYTKDPNEATEFTTFEYSPNIYRYADWYEVMEDGTEELYDFSKGVDHDMTLRLHWTKVGVFYLNYNAYDEDLHGGALSTEETTTEKLFVDLENGSYTDDANVLVTRVAIAPDGYEFVGWRIRGDASQKVYRPGDVFELQSKYAVMVQGKQRVYLDAVYTRVPTAGIIYDANGGVLSAAWDSYTAANLGGPTDENAPEAIYTYDSTTQRVTISNLVNNSQIVLADDTLFSRTDATFVGWSNKAVYDPDDPEAYLFRAGTDHETYSNNGTDQYRYYYVDASDPKTLYAVWQISVRYHLNQSGATWADHDGDLVEKTENGETFFEGNLYLDGSVDRPTTVPTSGDPSQMFLHWSTGTTSSDPTYGFSSAVTESLDLYAVWGAPINVTVHFLDASAATIAYKDTEWRDSTHTTISVSASTVTVNGTLAASRATTALTSNSDYVYAFAALYRYDGNGGIQHITEADACVSMHYDAAQTSVVVQMADGSTHFLGDDDHIFFIYYRKQTLDIGYMGMRGDGYLFAPTSGAPTSTALTQSIALNGNVYDMGAAITTPLTLQSSMTWPIADNQVEPAVDGFWATPSFTWYAYAIGTPTAFNAYHLALMTDSSNSEANGSRPSLQLRNTWRGIQYSTDGGTTWKTIGYSDDLKLFVIYYEEEPTVVTFHVDTIGFDRDMEQVYTYDYRVEEVKFVNGEEVVEGFVFDTRAIGTSGQPNTFTVETGSSYSAFLFTSPEHTYRVTFTQRAKEGFTTTVPSSDVPDYTGTIAGWSDEDAALSYTYTARPGDGYIGGTHTVTFTNTRDPIKMEIHLAQVGISTGLLFSKDDWRRDGGEGEAIDVNYTFMIAPGESKVLNTEVVPSVFLSPTAGTGYAAYGAAFFGFETPYTDPETNQPTGQYTVIPTSDDAMATSVLSFEPKEPGSDVYGLFVKAGDTILGELIPTWDEVTGAWTGTEYKLYYLFYPMLTIYYVWEGEDGTLTPITGSTDGVNESATITYGGEPLTLNGVTVSQGQKVEVPPNGLNVSQTVGEGFFNMPPLLDSGVNQYDLVYFKLGAIPQLQPLVPVTSTSEFGKTGDESGISENLILYSQIVDNVYSWRFDYEEFVPIDKYPVLYAIYRERGYDLTVQTTVPIDTGYDEPFHITITSTAINRTSYAVEGTGSSTISATITTEDDGNGGTRSVGTIEFDVRDGTTVKIIGLGAGDYTITETRNENYIMMAEHLKGNAISQLGNTVTLNDLSESTAINLINIPKVICRVGEMEFYTLTDAIEHIHSFASGATGTIEMLVDYELPSSDAATVPDGCHVTITTAPSPDYSGSGTYAKITRSSTFTSGAMLTNSGSLTLTNVILDGGWTEGASAVHGSILENEGTLTVGSGAVLENAHSTGNGAAIRGWNGSITVTGGTITGCSAQNGGAIYAFARDASAGSQTTGGNIVIGADALLTYNMAQNGGAIYYAGNGASVTLSGGTLAHNESNGNGGAVYMESGVAYVSGGTVTQNLAKDSGGGIYALNAYVNVTSGSITSNRAWQNGGGVNMQTLTLTVSGGSIANNTADLNGGAIWADRSSVVMNGGSLSGNAATAGNGGAVYCESQSFTMTAGTVTGNTAHTNGGGVFANSGTVSITHSSASSYINNNIAATGCGGGVYAASGAVTMSGANLTGNRANVNGGALWIGLGGATLTNVTMQENTSVNGSAIFNNACAVRFSGGTITNNVAGKLADGTVAAHKDSVDTEDMFYEIQNGGGAVGVGSLKVTTVQTVEATPTPAPTLEPGATPTPTPAVTPTPGEEEEEGGTSEEIVEVSATLEFSGNVQIKNNTLVEQGGVTVTSNVYLNQDSETIIRATGLGSSAEVGIYVPGDLSVNIDDTSELVRDRGVPSAFFGLFTNSANVSAFKNDRAAGMGVATDSSSSALYWSKTIQVQMRYLAVAQWETIRHDTLSSDNIKEVSAYNPPSGDNGVSEIATDLRSLQISWINARNPNASFGCAFVRLVGASEVSEAYVSEVNWDARNNCWKYIMRDVGSDVETNVEKLVIYYTAPYFLSIENNTEYDLYISDLYLTTTITGSTAYYNVLNTDVSSETPPITYAYIGDGYAFAINDAVQDELLPVYLTAGAHDDSNNPLDALVIRQDESIKILIPAGKNYPYTLNAVFRDSTGAVITDSSAITVPYTKNGTWVNNPSTGDIRNGAVVTVTGTMPSAEKDTSSIIFGTTRAICKIVIDVDPADLAAGSLAKTVKYYTHPDPDPDYPELAGKTEYAFAKPGDVFSFIELNRANTHPVAIQPLLDENNDPVAEKYIVKVDILMLTDFMISQSQIVDLNPANLPDPSIDHWDISFSTARTGKYRYVRDEGMVTISRATDNTSSFLLASNGNSKCNLTLREIIFDGKNHIGTNNGGIISTSGWNIVIDCCEFNNCVAKNGGGIYIDYPVTRTVSGKKYIDYAGTVTVMDTVFNICKSTGKDSREGGGAIWTMAEVLTVTNCTFTDCSGVDQGGAVFHRVDYKSGYAYCEYRAASTTNIEGCTFTNCQARTGGAIESDAYHVTVNNSRFTNCYSIRTDRGCGSGGAIATYIYEGSSWSLGDMSALGEAYKTTLDVSGCTFNHCTASATSNNGLSGFGGAIRSHSLITMIENSMFSNCTAVLSGGAITINNKEARGSSNYAATIRGCTITDCSATRENGGAIDCNTVTLTVEDYENPTTHAIRHTEIRGCTAEKDGGAICFRGATVAPTLIMTGVSIGSCIADATDSGESHGGGGVLTSAATVTMTDCSIDDCTTTKNGGGVHITVSSGQTANVTLAHTTISDCTGDSKGGGLYLYNSYDQNNPNNGALTVGSGSVLENNIAGTEGGGIYTNVKTLTVGGVSGDTVTAITGNQALTGNGGGIDHVYSTSNNAIGTTTLNTVTITDNISSGKGGGVYTNGSMVLLGTTSVTGNRLRTGSETANNAAGVYLENSRTLTIGETGSDATETVLTITDNMTVDGRSSNLRLPEKSNGTENDNKVVVKCGASGEIRVVNALYKTIQFGKSDIPNPVGFTDQGYIFIADDDSVYGIVNRTDATGTEIVWGGDPICKITDINGKQLYLDNQHTRPCVYDVLDNGAGSGAAAGYTSAMSTLRQSGLQLYYFNGDPYNPTNGEITYQVKMLVESYPANNVILATVNGSGASTARTVILTTASASDTMYPYRGRAGTRCTIVRQPAAQHREPAGLHQGEPEAAEHRARRRLHAGDAGDGDGQYARYHG